jgi:hypothetical protein
VLSRTYPPAPTQRSTLACLPSSQSFTYWNELIPKRRYADAQQPRILTATFEASARVRCPEIHDRAGLVSITHRCCGANCFTQHASKGAVGDLRKAPRYTFRCPAQVNEVTVENECVLRNLSLRGCYIETPDPRPIGSTIHLTICLGEDKVRAGAKVRFADIGTGMGVEFTHVSPAALFILKRLISDSFKGVR